MEAGDIWPTVINAVVAMATGGGTAAAFRWLGGPSAAKKAEAERDKEAIPQFLKLVEDMREEIRQEREEHRKEMNILAGRVGECEEKHSAAIEEMSAAKERDAKKGEAIGMLTDEVVRLRHKLGERDDTGQHRLVALRQEIVDATPQYGPPTVLVVDDDAAARRALMRSLVVAEYAVLEAGSAREALEVCGAQRVDVVVADVLMPGGSGPELARILRKRAPALPIVLVSGDSTLGARLARLEGVRFLPKPCTPEELANEVASAIATADKKKR